ncbi:hypothetical protein CH267_13295 [Rhodococcus sp. 06-621-2]|nr:MFS transporter [Rhodococcus sp. 06-621-2]OZC55903.1 hypothetical protein CH267_13295 [Rhodococcus sp. 06-621-2]
MYALYQGVQQILIPLQVQHIDPDRKVANLAILTAVVAVTSLIAIPIGGAISDRTRGRFGRRTPWLVGASLLSLGLLAIMGNLQAMLPLTVVYGALWFTANFYQGAWVGILPDRVPVARRGVASSVIGFATPLGILIGVNYAAQVPQNIAYLTLGLFLFGTTLILVFGAPEGPFEGHPPVKKERRSPLQLVGEFFSGFAHANFRYAFISRFLLYLSYFVVNGYLLYTLQDRIGVENLPGNSAAVGIGILTTINSVTWIAVASFCGWLADKFDRRKLFVGICAVGMGAGMLVPVFYPTWTGMIIYAVLVGGFKGAYVAIDLALMSLVLPNHLSAGRDMGLLSIATGTPQLISGAIAGLLITFAGGYTTLFIFGAFVSLLAGITILPIRGIR